jgi:hypothetical protein
VPLSKTGGFRSSFSAIFESRTWPKSKNNANGGSGNGDGSGNGNGCGNANGGRAMAMAMRRIQAGSSNRELMAGYWLKLSSSS